MQHGVWLAMPPAPVHTEHVSSLFLRINSSVLFSCLHYLILCPNNLLEVPVDLHSGEIGTENEQ